MDMEDAKIVMLLLERSEHAISALQQKFGGLCRSIIVRILSDARDVEECLNDIYIRVWNAIPPDRPVHLSGYMARIARNAALDRYDYNHAQMRSSALTEAFEELEAYLPSAVSQTEQSEFADFLNRFLHAQAKEARIFFVRRYWYGESVREISLACHCSEGKVKVSLFRTRNKLRDAMLKEGIYL
ncbi:MAG: sigma-70 family RNA polymerase sigma factor [Peptococcaceae bacterium]|nr:sigma-70 family RNA polymerase sigma factor [Peptococcaceae bacterium]MBO5428683.1 sigma-70 family RNA polymerase sigma factor [Peptococcaceae bacterium]